MILKSCYETQFFTDLKTCIFRTNKTKMMLNYNIIKLKFKKNEMLNNSINIGNT